MKYELIANTFFIPSILNVGTIKLLYDIILGNIDFDNGKPILITSNKRGTDVFITIIYQKSVII